MLLINFLNTYLQSFIIMAKQAINYLHRNDLSLFIVTAEVERILPEEKCGVWSVNLISG